MVTFDYSELTRAGASELKKENLDQYLEATYPKSVSYNSDYTEITLILAPVWGITNEGTIILEANNWLDLDGYIFAGKLTIPSYGEITFEGANLDIQNLTNWDFSSDLGGKNSDKIIGSAYKDIYYGGAMNDEIFGNGGNDNLYGDSGNDTLNGGSGNDLLDGGTGHDSLLGGIGDDTYYIDSTSDTIAENYLEGTDKVYSSVNFTLSSNLENLKLTGSSKINGTGNEFSNTIKGNFNKNTLSGGGGDDTLIGDHGEDHLKGGKGNDTLDGGKKNDSLFGETGNDLLIGGAGEDELIGGKGKDELIGGKGKDIFKLSKGEGYDLIKDFKNKQDKIFIGSMKKLKLKNKGNDVYIYKGKDLLAKAKGAKGYLSKKGKYLV